jgi:hypothetical protein
MGARAAWAEDRRHLADGAEIDGAALQGLDQLGTAGELEPLDVVAERSQRRLERAAGPQEREQPELLEADAHRDVRPW